MSSAMAFTTTPMSNDTNVNAKRIAPAPIAANSTLNQCTNRSPVRALGSRGW